MDPKFIRTFADDLSELRKKYRIHSKAEVLISGVVISLHHIARIVENGEDIKESISNPRINKLRDERDSEK